MIARISLLSGSAVAFALAATPAAAQTSANETRTPAQLASAEVQTPDTTPEAQPVQTTTADGDVDVIVTSGDGQSRTIRARCRIDTYNELEYFHAGGILPYVLRRLAAA